MKRKINILFYTIIAATQLDASLTESVKSSSISTQISFAHPTQAPTALQTLSTPKNKKLNPHTPNLRGTNINTQNANNGTLTGGVDYISLAGQNLTNITTPTLFPTTTPSAWPTVKPSLSPAQKRELEQHKAYLNAVHHQTAILAGVFGGIGGAIICFCAAVYPVRSQRGECCPGEQFDLPDHLQPNTTCGLACIRLEQCCIETGNGCPCIRNGIAGAALVAAQQMRRPVQPAQVPAQEQEIDLAELDAGLK